MSRVVFLCSHPFLGWKNGADIAALQLAQQLRARGHHCEIAIVLCDNPPAFAEWRARLPGGDADSLVIEGVPARVHRLALPAAGTAPDIVRSELAAALDRALAALLAEARPDVVLVPWGTVALARAARRHVERVLVWVQNGEAVASLGAETVRGLGLATVSPALAKRIKKQVGRAPLVILNPIERAGVVPEGGPRNRIGMVNFCAEKGALVFLNVAANLPALRFLGTGGWAGRAEDYTAMTTHLANVEIAPPYPRIADFYREVRVLLVPSLGREAFGRVVIEAQLCGIPVVCTSHCGAREWVTGLVVPARSRPAELPPERFFHDATLHEATIKGFLDALVTLDDPDNYALASEQARAAAERYFCAQTESLDHFERWLTREM